MFTQISQCFYLYFASEWEIGTVTRNWLNKIQYADSNINTKYNIQLDFVEYRASSLMFSVLNKVKIAEFDTNDNGVEIISYVVSVNKTFFHFSI